MRVTRDTFSDVMLDVSRRLDGAEHEEAVRDALRGVVVYVMALESALDRADNARRADAPNLPNPWQHVTYVTDAEPVLSPNCRDGLHALCHGKWWAGAGAKRCECAHHG